MGEVRRGFFEAFQATGRSVRHIKAGYLNNISVHITHNASLCPSVVDLTGRRILVSFILKWQSIVKEGANNPRNMMATSLYPVISLNLSSQQVWNGACNQQLAVFNQELQQHRDNLDVC